MHRLFALLSEAIEDVSERQGVGRLRRISSAVQQFRQSPPDMVDPLGYREGVERAADLLIAIYGNDAVAVARRVEALSGRVFARVVTRSLERREREAKRS